MAGLFCSECGNEPGGICIPIFECIDAADVGRIIGLCIGPLFTGDRPIIIPFGNNPAFRIESGVDGAREIDMAAAI